MGVVIIGPSGSGKGTQAELLAGKYGWEQISMGALGREEIDRGTSLGMELAKYWNAGKWAPNDLIIGLLRSKFEKVEGDFVLDGIPRCEEQILPLNELLLGLGKKLDRVIYLLISDDEAVKRLSARLICPIDGEMYNLLTKPPRDGERCDLHGVQMVRREDDRPEAIRLRLAEFHRTVEPVLSYYRGRGLLVEVNGERTIEEIHADILRQLQDIRL